MENGAMMADMIRKQRIFDKKVLKKAGEDAAAVYLKKILAYVIEVAEMANETRVFKFWSEDQNPRQGKVTEEFADITHFLISIGLDVDPELEEEVTAGLALSERLFQEIEADPIVMILEMVQDSVLFYRREPEAMDFWVLFGKLLWVARRFGITFENLYDAYLTKNMINHERQASGY